MRHRFPSPNATAGALQRHARQAGSASALFGTLMYSCGALAALAVSALANGTVLLMATVMVGCTATAFLLYRWLVGSSQPKDALAEAVV